VVDSCSFHGRRAQSRGRAGADASVRRPPLRGGCPAVLAAWGKSANSPLGTGAQTVRTWGASAPTPLRCAPRRLTRRVITGPPTALPRHRWRAFGGIQTASSARRLPARLHRQALGRASGAPRSAAEQGRRACTPSPHCLRAVPGPSLRTCPAQRAPQGSRRAASTAPVKRPGACLRSLARHVGGNACHLSRRPEISPDNP